MERKAFTMKIRPGCAEEYKRRHDQIWPELSQLLKEAGIFDYSIFLEEETLTLFAVQKLKEQNSADSLACAEIMKQWWDYMADLMDVHEDNSPICIPLREVFHMD